MSMSTTSEPAPPRSPWKPGGNPFGIPFHALTRVDLVDAPIGVGHAQIPDAPELKNHLGTVHGGMLFTLGEVAAAAAMTQLLWPELARLRGITRRASIEYLKPARGALTATAIAGMTLAEITAALTTQHSVDVPLTVELRDSDGLVVATLKVDWYVGRPKP